MDFFKIENDFVKIDLNPKLYNLETIYSAAYQSIEDAFVFFDGDPDIEITVNLSYKDNKKNNEKNLSELAKKFMNNLVNYTFYKINSKNKEILRALLLKKSFESINLEELDDEAESPESDSEEKAESAEEKLSEEEESVFEEEENLEEEDFEFDDPEGIAIPWEEKYGKEANTDGN